MRVWIALALVGLAAACREQATGPTTGGAAAPQTAETSTSASASSSAAPTPPPFRAGPASASATRPSREVAAYAVLAGGEGWSELPEQATEPGVEFDRSLPRRLAPLAAVVSPGLRLPPEVIQRIVRQNYGPIRRCYEQARARKPDLAGRVTVNFVIGRDGKVARVTAGSRNFDARDHDCIKRVFYGLKFPQPEGGIVTVGYPIDLSP